MVNERKGKTVNPPKDFRASFTRKSGTDIVATYVCKSKVEALAFGKKAGLKYVSFRYND